VTIPTVHNTLKRLDLSRKIIKRHASQRDDELRSYWAAKQSSWRAVQLVYVDESGASERSAYRRYGWAPKGLECHVSEELKRHTRWSILPAYSIEGYLITRMFQGSFNKEMYESFIIDDLLPLCTPFPGPRSIIIMDNASIHGEQSGVIGRACAEAGVLLQLLPPYSPDYNPIESSFGDLKSWIKRHYKNIPEYPTFGEFLKAAIAANGGPIQAKAHFQHAGIEVGYIHESDLILGK
jgi:transposase